MLIQIVLPVLIFFISTLLFFKIVNFEMVYAEERKQTRPLKNRYYLNNSLE